MRGHGNDGQRRPGRRQGASPKAPPSGRVARSGPEAPETRASRPRSGRSGGWRVALALSALSLVLFGAYRLWPRLRAGRPAASEAALQPVTLLPLDHLDEAVREQIAAAYQRPQNLAAAPAAEQAAAWGALGQVLLVYGLDAAEPALRNAVACDPTAFGWHYYLGRFYHLRDDFTQARTAYETALALRPEDIPTQLRLAQLSLEADAPGAAASEIEALLAREPDNAYAHYLNGEAAAALGDDKAAAAAYGRALDLQPSASRLRYLLAMTERRLGRMDEAARQLALRGDVPVRMVDPLTAELEALRRSGQVLVQQANAADREGRPEEARLLLERAVQLDPQDGGARQNLGLLRLRTGEVAPALTDLAAAVALEPANARFRISLAVAQEAAGRRELAEAALREALRLDAQDADAQAAMADFLRRGDRCGEAEAFYAAAIGVAPSRALFRVQQAVCRVRAGDSRAALDGLVAARRDFPADAAVADALARVLAAAPDSALRDPAAALALIEPLAAPVAAGMDVLETTAMALAAGGRFGEAIATQERALALAQDRPDWRQALDANLGRYRARQPAAAPWPDFLYRSSR